MDKIKKIEEEIKEAEVKKDEIKKEIDINQVNIKANEITDVSVEIFNKKYKISELIKITDKVKKNYEEIEIAKKFKLLMKNYYEGISYAVLRHCCGKKYTINDLKEKLKNPKTYELIDVRCSRKTIRFNKETVDTVVKLAEKYNFDK